MIEDFDRLSIRAGHGVGKTTFISWVALGYLLKSCPCKIAVTANTQDQLRDTIWSEMRVWASELPLYLRDRLDFMADHVYLKGSEQLAYITARTASADNTVALQGLHSPHMLFIIEEASGIPDEVFKVAHGSLSTPGAKIVMIANPTRNSGYFYESHTSDRARWKTMAVSSESVPLARGHVEEFAEKYGRDSNEYRVRVLGEFPLAERDMLVPLHLCEAAINRKVSTASHVYPVWGVDVGGESDTSDRSVLTKRQGNRLLEKQKVWQGLNTMQLVGSIVQEWKATPEEDRPSEILVDSIGIGYGVSSRLQELGLPARGINVGENPSSSGQYVSLRDELAFAAKDWFSDRNCSMPDEPELIAETTSIKLLPPTSSGKSRVERKEDTKKRIGRSPDRWDSFVITFAGGLDRIPDEQMDRYRKVVRPVRRGSWMSV